MKKALLAFVAVAFIGSVAFAQGDMGMTFTFNGLDNLGVGTINGGTIGLKKAMSDGQWLLVRAGVGMAKDTETAQADGFEDAEETDTQFNLAVGMQMDMAATDRVVPYIGGLVGFGWMQNKDIPMLASDPTAGTTLETKMTTLDFGARGMLGFEYFVRETVSLGGDYTFGFGYSKDKTEVDIQDGDTVETEGSGWNFGPFGAVNAVINVYFGG